MRSGTARILLATMLALALLLAASAQASRPATSAEARAIRTAALHALEGRSWRVGHIRVSTVKTSDRYAAAAVDDTRTGVGGEMILRRHNGRWSRLFLGTNDFCTAAAPRAVLNDLGFRCLAPKPRLRVEPGVVSPGGQVTFTGSGFRGTETVRLYAGPPQSEADPIGSTRTDSHGAFRKVISVGTVATSGRYIVLACQRSCQLKASSSFAVSLTGRALKA